MNQGIVLGIDGGGTFTRVAVADLDGNILGFSKKAGSHPAKNLNPEENVNAAIKEALEQANHSIQSVQYVFGGFAGLNDPKDVEWAKQYVLKSGIQAPSILVNDAEIAQYGAFLGGAGVLAIAGTGSIVLGKTEEGLIIKNYDFHHDSQSASRFLAYSALYEIISYLPLPEDKLFIDNILNYWGARDIADLSKIASKGFAKNNIEAIQKLSNMGGIITNEAAKGNKIAYRACEKAVESLVTGVLLVSSLFSLDEVPLSFVGGVASDPFIQAMLKEKLNSKEFAKKFSFKSSQVSPVLGAILYAYHKMGIKVSNEIVERLLNSDKEQYLF